MSSTGHGELDFVVSGCHQLHMSRVNISSPCSLNLCSILRYSKNIPVWLAHSESFIATLWLMIWNVFGKDRTLFCRRN